MICHGGDAPNGATWDHLRPRKGGWKRGDMLANTLLAHEQCNRSRDQKPIADRLLEFSVIVWSEWLMLHHKEVEFTAETAFRPKQDEAA